MRVDTPKVAETDDSGKVSSNYLDHFMGYTNK